MNDNSTIHFLHKLPAHFRLFICLLVAFIIFITTRGKTSYAFQFMYSWIGFALSNLIFFWGIIATAEPHEIKLIAKKQDLSRLFIYLFVLFSSFVSLLAVILLLKISPGAKHANYYHIALSVISVVFSWLLIHTIFTFRYAHLYYTCITTEQGIDNEHIGGLIFPDDDEPDYMDFAYFAFVIGMTFQVSDVQVTSSKIRWIVLLHGFLSFVYNTVILALSINIISGLVQK